MSEKKRPLGLKANRDIAKKSKDYGEQKPGNSALSSNQTHATDEEVLSLPNELPVLDSLFNMAISAHLEDDPQCLKWFNGTIHECDAMLRNGGDLPPNFYLVYGDSLFYLATVESDFNPEIYEKDFEKLRMDSEFLEAAK